MIYFLDTEFHESGPNEPIELISIGILADDGLAYYAVCSDFDEKRARKNKWLNENVLKHIDLDDKKVLRSKAEIKEDILMMLRDDKDIKFVADFCSYDWVVFCQIFGAMIDLPKGFPMYCNDLQTIKNIVGAKDEELPKTKKLNHHALEDAQELKEQWAYLESRFKKQFGKKLKI